jgi:hypothetical protein
MNTGQESLSNRLPHWDYEILKISWLEFVRFERVKLGLEAQLPPNSYGLCCGLSRTSYPHWPPSHRREALDQLRSLLGQSAPHRQYLASCWMTYLSRKHALQGWEESELSRTITLVRNNCPAVSSWDQHGLHEVSKGKKKSWTKKDCDSVCVDALKNPALSLCLCCCPEHREQCPIHRLSY